ncbi:hypothetical protein BGZ63DRAFT_363482 [Mariannaea sp. PMI_226]|nr:hypothetical protein BGZ63DRAFT_363482 [Mariannaea sp. PMI_226]
MGGPSAAAIDPDQVDISSDDAPNPISTLSSETVGATGGRIKFTDLPLEIRLHIYHWLHLISPIRHAQLAPWYPTPVRCQYFLRRVNAAEDEELPSPSPSEDPTHEDAKRKLKRKCTPTPGLLSPLRPLAGLPTALLQCNSQIYHEARSIPFMQNEFVFVNWFASGLWAGRAFTKALKPWQRDDLRFVRLEMLARDLASGSAGEEEWLSLCSDWAEGLRGLRVKVVLGATGTGSAVLVWGAAAAIAAAGVANGLDRQSVADAQEVAIEARGKVLAGLRRLKRLEMLEVELVTRHMKSREKVAWCSSLEEELRQAGLVGVRVVCTEKVQEKMEWMKREAGMKHLQAAVAY